MLTIFLELFNEAAQDIFKCFFLTWAAILSSFNEKQP